MTLAMDDSFVAERFRALLDRRVAALAVTDREREVVALVLRGFADKQIAGRLGVSLQTVKNHLQAVFARTGAGGRTDLLRILVPELFARD